MHYVHMHTVLHVVRSKEMLDPLELELQMVINPGPSARVTSSRNGEIAQWLRAQSAFPEVLSSIPSNHIVAHSHL